MQKGLSNFHKQNMTAASKADDDDFPRKRAGWWRNLTEVKYEILAFNSMNDFSNSQARIVPIPPENKLRGSKHGMALIHAIRKHGGVRRLKAKLYGWPNETEMSFDQEASATASKRGKLICQQNSSFGGFRRFAQNNGEFLASELMRFNEQFTNNKHLRIMPSVKQLRRAKRQDLVSAVDRFGGW
jgi:hypothetical protein